MAIYTKRGDKGETSIFSSSVKKTKQISKGDQRIRAIGSVDEANSYLGICLSYTKSQKLEKILVRFQKDLFEIGSILAGVDMDFNGEKIKNLEKIIDVIEGELPVLDRFILPGGTRISSHLMYARTLVRKTEREVATLSKSIEVEESIFRYLNRLSDAIFILARKENFKEGVSEEVWTKKDK